MGEKGLSPNAEDVAWQRLQNHQRGQVDPWQRDPGSHGNAFNTETGQNAHWDSDKGQWTDSKTGEALTPPLLK